ncbi:MAG: response regulator [Alphaproteobacteria bacterium]
MEVIKTSAEHHFLTTLQKIKKAPAGWAGLYFSLSKNMPHKVVIKQPAAINKTMSVERQKAQEVFDSIQSYGEKLHKSIAYLFEDNDIVVLMPLKSSDSKALFQKIYQKIAAELPENMSDFALLEHELYSYQKLADQKIISAKAMQAYRAMSDRNKISSLSIRREKRDYPLVQVIEDDRFTASYTSNILNREYDMVLNRNGEEGILTYIENAPDIVFIDIHLPGLNGHQVLESLKIIDPNVYAVMLSVDTVKDNIVKSAEVGANNFLKKPFSRDRLINIVKNSPFVQSTLGRNAASLRTH